MNGPNKLECLSLASLFSLGPIYKAFYGRKLMMFVIAWSVCSWQAFTA